MLTCTKCGSMHHVIDQTNSGANYEGIYRIRRCKDCGNTWTTYEMDADYLRSYILQQVDKEMAKFIKDRIKESKLDKARKKAIAMSLEFNYGDDIRKELSSAETEIQISQILAKARKR